VLPFADQTSFAAKIAGVEDADDRFLALIGQDRKLDLPVLNVKDGVRWRALAIDPNASLECRAGHATMTRGERVDVKRPSKL
jgi:hypothetical protein